MRESGVGGRLWPCWLAFLIPALAACLYTGWDFLAGTGLAFEGADDTGYYLWARTLVVDRDLAFAADVATAPSLTEEARQEWLQRVDSEGRVLNKYAPGWGLLMLPAMILGHGLAGVSGVAQDGWTAPYLLAVWFWHGAWIALGLFAAVRVASRWATPQDAVLAVALTAAATPLVYYGTARFAMVHGLIFSLSALASWLGLRVAEGRARMGEYLVLGSVAGLLFALRPTAVAGLVWPAWELLKAARRGGRFQLMVAAAVPAAGVVALGWLLVRLATGTWFAEPYPGERFHWFEPEWVQALFSARHGVFHSHPFLMVGLALLVTGCLRSGQRLPWALLAGLAILGWANAAWWCWWFGSSFGNRAYDLWWFGAMLGLAWGLSRAGEASRRWIFAGAGVATLMNLLWLGAWLLQRIPRSEPVTYSELFRSILP